MKGIHSTQFHCYISFLSLVLFTTCFLSSQGQLLDSHKCQLFCLHATCLFKWWTPVSSSEAAICRFCLSISLQIPQISVCPVKALPFLIQFHPNFQELFVCIYPIPPEHDMTQGQFLSKIKLVWIQSFPSPQLVAISKLNSPVCLTIYS